MNAKYFFASAAVASMLVFTTSAQAQVLGGGLSGAVGGTLSGGLSGMGGLDGIGGITSTATSSARDVNSIGRASTQHAHDTVAATADATDRAAANVDKQLKAADAAANTTANAASSATSNVDANTDAAQPKLSEPKAPAPKESKPVKTVKQEPIEAPRANISAQGSASAQSNASVER